MTGSPAVVKSMIVDPPRDGNSPPSIKASTESLNCDRTSSAVRLDASPLRFALVAVIGVLRYVTRVVANSAAGHRTPIVCVPAVTLNGTHFAAGKMTVRGPGQKCVATA
jgi:hypothetical protein